MIGIDAINIRMDAGLPVRLEWSERVFDVTGTDVGQPARLESSARVNVVIAGIFRRIESKREHPEQYG